jgi:hypothetical protein
MGFHVYFCLTIYKVTNKAEVAGRQKSPLSLQALLVCRPPDLSYLRNLNAPITCWLTWTPILRLTQLASATKVMPLESIARVCNRKGMGR